MSTQSSSNNVPVYDGESSGTTDNFFQLLEDSTKKRESPATPAREKDSVSPTDAEALDSLTDSDSDSSSPITTEENKKKTEINKLSPINKLPASTPIINNVFNTQKKSPPPQVFNTSQQRKDSINETEYGPKATTETPNANFEKQKVQNIRAPEVVEYDSLPPQLQMAKKRGLLIKLNQIKLKHGVVLTKNYTINDDFHDIHAEYQAHYDEARRKDTSQYMTGGVISAIHFLERLNGTYDYFGLDLDGWAEMVEMKKDNVEEIMGELYDKYKMSERKWEPEFKLAFVLGFSAYTLNMQKKAQQNEMIGGLVGNNPELFKKMNQYANQTAVNNFAPTRQQQMNMEDQQVYNEFLKQKKMIEEQRAQLVRQQNIINQYAAMGPQQLQQQAQQKIQQQQKQMQNQQQPARPNAISRINQLRRNIGVRGGNPTETEGNYSDTESDAQNRIKATSTVSEENIKVGKGRMRRDSSSKSQSFSQLDL